MHSTTHASLVCRYSPRYVSTLPHIQTEVSALVRSEALFGNRLCYQPLGVLVAIIVAREHGTLIVHGLQPVSNHRGK